MDKLANSIQGICAGKHAVVDYLVAFEGFTLIHRVSEQDLLSRVTQDSHKRWVTIINESYEYVSQALLGRPFFLLVYIDAPLLTRWARYKNRCVQGFLSYLVRWLTA
jgi:dCMP deaminase